ncbi:cortex morphogenetic protein CmpA [Paenibacillus sp. SYP-B4298]|nr:cortex morphogenetic protein CmpA [Paenibacillus sp. SYP-B4298]
MPQWLCNQLMRAYSKKDRRQIRLLNDCWFFYRNRSEAGKHSSASLLP